MAAGGSNAVVEERGGRDAVDPEAPLGAGEVAVAEHVQAAVLGVHEVRVDVALGARVAAVGVVVEVDAPVLGDGGAQHLEDVGAAEPEVDVEHLVGVDAEHRGQLGHAAAERAVGLGARQREHRRAGGEQRDGLVGGEPLRRRRTRRRSGSRRGRPPARRR